MSEIARPQGHGWPSGAWGTLAIVAMGSLATLVLAVEPAFEQRFELQLHLTPRNAGLLVGSEFLASMLASLALPPLARRLGTRLTATVALVGFVLANACSARWPTLVPLLLSRLLAGAAAGSLLVVVLACAARSSSAARHYALWVAGQLLAGAALARVLPACFAAGGLGAAYLLLALLGLALLPGVWALPAADLVASGTQPPRRGIWRPLLALFLFYVVAAGLWAFVADRHQPVALELQLAARGIALANLAGLAGALLAARISDPGQRRALVAGHGLLAVSLALFAWPGEWSFLPCAILLQFAWSFSAPLLLAGIGPSSDAEKDMGRANICIGAALAAGPAIAGAWLTALWGTVALVITCALAIVLAACLALGNAGVPQGDSA
jgi:predicted MFS family arabinose efflux permease